jgi:hypothetical protein
MAKKTSYLTELIERHERWKAEGGGKQEEHDNDADADLWVFRVYIGFPLYGTYPYFPDRITANSKTYGTSELCAMEEG